jgi:signal transduction histidine kinase
MNALGSRLYLRIWLAVVAAVAVITLAVGWAWRVSREATPREMPMREIILRNAAGEVIAQSQGPAERRPGRALVFDLQTVDGQQLELEVSRPPRPGGPPHAGPPDRIPGGLLGWRPPLSFFWLLLLVALAVALGAYPVIRRLTQRLEALQIGVERWGRGDLSARVVVQGHDEVAFLAERFNQAAERIERLMASHKTLLANASHELRSPLARIRMSVELMGPDASPVQRNEIARSIGELDQLIDEILLASRLDRQQDEAEPMEEVDLLGLAAEECARVGAQLLDLPPGAGAPVVQGSPRLLRRLLRNLLENAIRHGARPVTLAIDPREADWRLQVCDRGSGVPPVHREQIFEPFYRPPGASETAGGVGLGLALVRSIAKRHGGSVRCLEAPGGGTCFEVLLPRYSEGTAFVSQSDRP